MKKTTGTDNISPTAHYTGAVWVRNGLSHPRLETRVGRIMYRSLVPLNATARLWRQPSLEGLLLARHRVIDQLLCEAIDAARISQVVEIAAGLSPRGWRISAQYPSKLSYVETDLPGMMARKRRLLVELGALPKRHRIETLDALVDSGPESLTAVLDRLDPDKGVAIITEGLLNYFDRSRVEDLWGRIAQGLTRFSSGLYLSDLHVASEQPAAVSQSFRMMLSTVVRSRVHFHFDTADEVESRLVEAGFQQARCHRPCDRLPDASQDERRSSRLVRIIAAETQNAP